VTPWVLGDRASNTSKKQAKVRVAPAAKQVLGAGHDAWTIGDWRTRGRKDGGLREDLF
jgi:hypothetical protein